MIKKIRSLGKVTDIDLWIYVMKATHLVDFPPLHYPIQSEVINASKKRFYIKVGDIIIHESFLYTRLFVLRIIGKKGPAIGDCHTLEAYKGQSLYPYVIHHIAQEEIRQNRCNEVFIAVQPNNVSSIKGIEKAGFQLHSKIKAKRFLIFHFQVKIAKV